MSINIRPAAAGVPEGCTGLGRIKTFTDCSTDVFCIRMHSLVTDCHYEDNLFDAMQLILSIHFHPLLPHVVVVVGNGWWLVLPFSKPERGQENILNPVFES